MSVTSPQRFAKLLQEQSLSLPPRRISTLQMNITRLCNQACQHCHVDASPKRREMMSDEVMEACLEVLKAQPEIQGIDITGGAPELHPG
ncbi:MAG: radical SAM protein, partial [Candidatus Melainabacteria bacterium HGW-Melainabacteria-1]